MKNSKKTLIIISIIPVIAACNKTNINSTFQSTYSDYSLSISSSENNDSSLESSLTSISSESSTSINQTSNIELESYWSSLDLNAYGNTFRSQLQSLINKTGNKTISYKANNEVLKQSDKSNDGKGIIPFYHSSDESYTGEWNKEHVWPNSRGAGKSGPGSNPHMLRPTISSENSSRSNYFYGNGSSDGKNTWDPGSLGYENARGEAARIIFYCATKYYNTCGSGGTSKGSKPLELSNNPNDNKDLHTMGRLDRLIEWNNKYPVTSQEKKRNEYLYKNNFGRNPFIDHPEFANYIWNSQGIRNTKYEGSILLNNNENSSSTAKDENNFEYDVLTDLDYLSTNNTISVINFDNQ